ncbi:hypothetical protein EJ110_NYTH58996 [Nymphaea thermarum]|nr:hypothetical protein EJ110_NYTH58996 [Nymphaea thermarum]
MVVVVSGSGQGPDPDPQLTHGRAQRVPPRRRLILLPLSLPFLSPAEKKKTEVEQSTPATEVDQTTAAVEQTAAAMRAVVAASRGTLECLRWLPKDSSSLGSCFGVHRARPVDLEFVARGVLKNFVSAPQMEYQRRGKKRVEPSTEAQREPSPAHSDAHTPQEDDTSGQQNAQASVGAPTPPRQTPPVDQQVLLLTTLQTLTSIVQSMAGNQRSQASPTGDTTAPPKEKATTVTFHHFMTMQPPVFTGDGSPDKAEEWIEEIERIFEVLEVPGGVNFGSYMLKGDAQRWWKSTREIQFADQQTISWRQFRDSFFSTYFPVQAKNKKMREFLDLQQKHLSLEENITKYRHLEAYYPAPPHYR